MECEGEVQDVALTAFLQPQPPQAQPIHLTLVWLRGFGQSQFMEVACSPKAMASTV